MCEMLRIAVPNKGSLASTAAEMLKEAGYEGRRTSNELHVVDSANGVEFFFLRPRDIATYVGSGALDAGITGRDLLLDSGSSAREIASLGFGDSTFRFAGPSSQFQELSDLRNVRVATSYPGLVGAFLEKAGIEATLIRLDGAVESAVRLGVADAVADVVSTGSTLRAAGLAIFGPVILESTAVAVTSGSTKAGLDVFLRRIQGVVVAREYVLLDYDVPVDLLASATDITSGYESPTVSPLHESEWVAVRVMVRVDKVNPIMDSLHELGAKAIVVTKIHAARL